MSATCPICDTVIKLIPDGKLRYCECQSLGVDHTKNYTRYIGIMVKEHQDFEKYREQINKCRFEWLLKVLNKEY